MVDLIIPELATARVLLRPVTEADAGDVFRIGSDPAVLATVFWPEHKTLDDSLRFIRFLHNDDIVSTGIRAKQTGELIGTMFFYGHKPMHSRIEIAFNMAQAHWGRGLATEAVKAVLDHCREHWPINRVEGTCMVDNIASARVMEKTGFNYEGTMRQSHFRQGKYHDMKLYAWVKSARR